MSAIDKLPPSVIEAFHLMWGNYPEPASLVYKTHEVVAVNKVYETLGYLKPGMNCTQLGTPDNHRGCLASKCIKEQQTKYTYMGTPEKKVLAFWLPIDGYPEFFIHFGVGNTIDYEKEISLNNAQKILIKKNAAP